MQIVWLIMGTVVGIATSIALFHALIFGAALLSNCFKTCNFAVLPVALVVSSPLIISLLRAVRRLWRGEIDLHPVVPMNWLVRNSIPIGMALSLLRLNRTASSLIISIAT